MLNFKKRKWIVTQKEKGNLTDLEIADSQNITRRSVQKIWSKYKQNSLEFLKEKPLGRKVDEVPATIKKAILDKRNLGYGIRKILFIANIRFVSCQGREYINNASNDYLCDAMQVHL